MPLPSVGSLFSLLVLGGPLSSTPLPECAATVRVDVRATSPELPPVACLSPGEFTTLRLDSELLPGLEGLAVVGEGRPLQVDRGTYGITFSLPDDFPTGGHYLVTLRFAGNSAPESATLELVVHPSLLTRQVRLYRHERPAGELAQEAQAAWAEARQCKEEKARLQAACTAAVGLRALLAGVPPDENRFRYLDLTEAVTTSRRDALRLGALYAYRVKAEVVLAVQLENPSNTPWAAMGATLKNPEGEQVQVVQVVQESPMAPGEKGWVLVALAPDAPIPQGPLALTLWGEGGVQTVSLGDITLP